VFSSCVQRKHRPFNIIRAVLGLTLLTLLTGSAAEAGNKDPEVWYIKQNGVLMGSYDVYVSDTGIRLENSKNHVIVVASAPSWTVTAFNSDSKIKWLGTIANYRPTASTRRFMTIASDVPSNNAIKFPHQEPFSQFGLKGIKYFTDTAWTLKQKVLYEKNQISKQYPCMASYFGAQDAIKATQPIAILENLFDTPRMGLLPVDFHYKKITGHMENVLTTVSAKKQAPPRDWLTVPNGLSVVNSLEAINLDSTGRQGMDQWLDNIGTHR